MVNHIQSIIQPSSVGCQNASVDKMAGLCTFFQKITQLYTSLTRLRTKPWAKTLRGKQNEEMEED